MQELLNQNRIAFGEDHTTVPSRKLYLEETKYEPARSILLNNSTGKEDLLELFDEAPFAFPKPVSLIKTLIAMHPEKDIKVLDFFAGSGTTGHAVMQLNKEDGGSRSFILVEQMDYAEDLTMERIIRAMNKYEYDESFTYEVFDSHGQQDDASQESVKACDAS
jgi:adenine specific DNA methylase Mod